jgi:hypothetical protein
MQHNDRLKLKLKECAELLTKVAEEGVASSDTKLKKVINITAIRSLYGTK